MKNNKIIKILLVSMLSLFLVSCGSSKSSLKDVSLKGLKKIDIRTLPVDRDIDKIMTDSENMASLIEYINTIKGKKIENSNFQVFGADSLTIEMRYEDEANVKRNFYSNLKMSDGENNYFEITQEEYDSVIDKIKELK